MSDAILEKNRINANSAALEHPLPLDYVLIEYHTVMHDPMHVNTVVLLTSRPSIWIDIRSRVLDIELLLREKRKIQKVFI